MTPFYPKCTLTHMEVPTMNDTLKRDEKQCSCCGGIFKRSEFGRNRQTPDGLAYYTKEHAAAKQRVFRRTHPELVKESRDRYLNKLRARNGVDS